MGAKKDEATKDALRIPRKIHYKLRTQGERKKAPAKMGPAVDNSQIISEILIRERYPGGVA